MPKQGLEMKSGEPENAYARPSDPRRRKKKKKKKKSRVIEVKTEAYVCSICKFICDCPTVFECHLKRRKHKNAAKIKKHTEALLDDMQIEEEIIQDNGHSKEMIEEIQFQPGEAHEHIRCLEKQNKELGENENKPLPKEQCNFTELNPEFSGPQEAREGVDDVIKKLELSQDATLIRDLESIANQNLEMNSGDSESNGGATEHPEEYMDKKKKNGEVNKEDYVCSICSVFCNSPVVFESHLLGRKHAAKIKKHEEKQGAT